MHNILSLGHQVMTESYSTTPRVPVAGGPECAIVGQVDVRSSKWFQFGKVYYFHIVFYQSFFLQQDQIVPSSHSSYKRLQTLSLTES